MQNLIYSLIITVCSTVSIVAQLQSIAGSLTSDTQHIFYEEIIPTSSGQVYALFSKTNPIDNLPSPIIAAFDESGSMLWQKKILHNRLSLYPETFIVKEDGDLIIAMTDYDNQNGFLSSNVLLVETDHLGNHKRSFRIGNVKAQLIKQMMPLDASRMVLLVHHGGSEGYGTALITVNTDTYTIENSKILDDRTLTYLDRIIPLTNGEYLCVGREANIGEQSAALAVLLNTNLELKNSVAFFEQGTQCNATYGTYATGVYSIYCDYNNEGIRIELDQNFNVTQSEELGFLTINDHFEVGNKTYLVSNSLNAIFAYEGNVPLYANIIAADNGYVELFRPSLDQKHFWGLNNNLSEGIWSSQITKQPWSESLTCESFRWENIEKAPYNIASGATGVRVSDVQYTVFEDTPSMQIVESIEDYNITCMEVISSIQDPLTSSFKIVPNPATSTVHIPDAIEEVFIYDTHSKLIKHVAQPNGQIDISAYPAGVYVMKSHEGTSRFVKL